MEVLALANTEFYSEILKESICSEIALGKYMAGRNSSNKEVFQKISKRRGPATKKGSRKLRLINLAQELLDITKDAIKIETVQDITVEEIIRQGLECEEVD